MGVEQLGSDLCIRSHFQGSFIGFDIIKQELVPSDLGLGAPRIEREVQGPVTPSLLPGIFV